MSISIAIPPVGNLNSDAPGLHGAGLIGVTGPELSNLNSNAHPSPNPVLSSGNRIAIPTETIASTGLAAGGLDPLTPQGHTVQSTAALNAVIRSVSSTLTSLEAGSAASSNAGVGQLSELVKSPGFQSLFQVLGAGAANGSSSSNAALASLAAVSPAASVPATPSSATSNSAPAPSSGPVNSAPYFQKLLGELESTYKTAPSGSADQTTSSFETSEVDLFLKWLSLNGSNSVAASA